MGVRRSWDGEAVCSELQQISDRINHPAAYVISDNASIMNKGVRKYESVHIKDVSHTLGMFMEHVYKGDELFQSYYEGAGPSQVQVGDESVGLPAAPQATVHSAFLKPVARNRMVDKDELCLFHTQCAGTGDLLIYPPVRLIHK